MSDPKQGGLHPLAYEEVPGDQYPPYIPADKTTPEFSLKAIVLGAIFGVAASIAGDTSQDIKTGFLLGATPRKQQIGEVI